MHLVHMTASLGIGGAESVLSTLVQELQKGSIKQTVIAFREGPYADQLRSAGIQIFIIHGLLVRYDPLFWIRLVRLIKKLHPDCIHSLLWASNVAARFLGKICKIPVVTGMHNNILLYGRLSNVIDRITLPFAHHVVVIHEGVKQSIISRCAYHDKLPISIIHNCIDSKKVLRQAFADPHRREEFGFDESHFVVGAVGRFIPIKRYSLLIQHFAGVYKNHRHARLLLVGYGPKEDRLRDLVKELQLEEAVRFIVGKKAYGYFPLFNCFVLSSLTEGPAIALLEAMSFKLPCIVTHDAPMHPVIVDRANGILLTRPEDSLSDAILLLIGNKFLCEQLGERALCTVQSQFSASIMAASYQEVFTSVLPKNGKRRLL